MNILLVGSDSRAGLSRRQLGRIQTVQVPGQRTDTIMILHLSPRRDRAVLVSLPRDLRTEIDGHTSKRSTPPSPWAAPTRWSRPSSGPRGCRSTTTYAEIDFAGLLKVVDALGGITLCNRSGRRLDDSYANLHMAPGCHHMNGIQALAFVRARHVDSDFGRIGRQQEFMRAVVAKMESKATWPTCPS